MPVAGNVASTITALLALLALGGLGLVLASVMAVRSAGGSSAQIGATGQALMQSQRLAKAVLQALAGQPQAFAEVRDLADAPSGRLRVTAPVALARQCIVPLLPGFLAEYPALQVELADAKARNDSLEARLAALEANSKKRA